MRSAVLQAPPWMLRCAFGAASGEAGFPRFALWWRMSRDRALPAIGHNLSVVDQRTISEEAVETAVKKVLAGLQQGEPGPSPACGSCPLPASGRCGECPATTIEAFEVREHRFGW